MNKTDNSNPKPMADIMDYFPEYIQTQELDRLRATEYSYLDEQDHMYLDYTGSSLAARIQYSQHTHQLSSCIMGNPHSVNPTSHIATALIEKTRARILSHLSASNKEYAVIFTANATGAARLVGESYEFSKSNILLLTSDNHNSIHGLREFARKGGALVKYIRSHTPDLRISISDIHTALAADSRSLRYVLGLLSSCNSTRDYSSSSSSPSQQGRGRGLFAFPAQSNFSGVRHPLEWVSAAQDAGYDVLLDAAAYLATSILDLSQVKPQFVTISWYKLFGYPTGLGCLVARRDALARLKRPWFSGGTIQTVSTGIPWHLSASGEAAFEDGTVNFLHIPAVGLGLDWLAQIGMPIIATRVRCLTGYFLYRLRQLKHEDDSPMIKLYGPDELLMRGGTVCFNFLDVTGQIVDERLVAKESADGRISLRTGCFCNPGAWEDAFGIDEKMLRSVQKSNPDSIERYINELGLRSAGAVRVSFGMASNIEDLKRFFAFAETYKNRKTSTKGLASRVGC